MARTSKSIKKRPQRPRRAQPRPQLQNPWEGCPALKPIPSTEGPYWELDIDELTPEQRAEWDRLEAEAKWRWGALHERFAKRAAYRAAVHGGQQLPSNPKPNPAPALGQPVDLRQFLPARAKALRRQGAIDDNISRRKLARLLVEESRRTKDAGLNIRVLSAEYLKDVLERFNVWPVSIID